MFGRLNGILGFAAKPREATPDAPLWAIGDVHGELNLLKKMLAMLPKESSIVLLGDYVDRGPDSAGVLRLLSQEKDMLCLLGNHEEMLLQFLDTPEAAGSRWINHGGYETLVSFDVPVTPRMTPGQLRQCRDTFATALGEELIAWLRNLPRAHLTGNVLLTHAGADPRAEVNAQADRHLTWGHRDFDRKARRDGIWVVHGHTIVPEACVRKRRIAVDTGAYATGRLTAVGLGQVKGQGAPQFLVAEEA